MGTSGHLVPWLGRGQASMPYEWSIVPDVSLIWKCVVMQLEALGALHGSLAIRYGL